MSKLLNKSNISDYFDSSDKNKNKTPIDAKREEAEGSDEKKTTNPKKFVGDLFINLLSAFLFFYLGASILTISKFYLFNKMGGTNINGPPYSPFKGKVDVSSVGGANTLSEIQKRLASYYNSIFGLNTFAFPYKNLYSQSSDKNYGSNFVSWITNALAFSFSSGRMILFTVLSLIGQSVYGDNCTNMKSCQPPNFPGNLIEVIALLTIPFLIFLSLAFPIGPASIGLFTFLTVGFSMITNIKKVALEIPILADFVGDNWSIFATFLIGLVFIYSWIWMGFVGTTMSLTIGATSIVQSLLLVSFVLVGPLFEKVSRENLKSLMLKRLPLLLTIVFGFLSQSAFKDLGETGGWGITGTAIGFFIITIYTLFNKTNQGKV